MKKVLEDNDPLYIENFRDLIRKEIIEGIYLEEGEEYTKEMKIADYI